MIRYNTSTASSGMFFSHRGTMALLSLLAVSLALPVWAQNDDDDEVDEDIEEVLVTGSLIRGTPVDGASPVQTLTRVELEAQGTPTVTEIVRNLGISNGNLGEANQFQSNSQSGEGISSINIRGLGPERTLVLLNSRRQPYAAYGSGNFTNLNVLPAIAIQRVELLKEGAASTYGSDAVAGVGNVITRGNFEGLELSFNHRIIDGSDGENQLGFIWGTEYAPGSNVVLSLGIATRSELPVSERREWAYLPPTKEGGQGWSGIGNPGTWIGAEAFEAFEVFEKDGFKALFATGHTFADPGCSDPVIADYSADDGVCRFRYTPFDNLIENETHNQFFIELNHLFESGAKLHVDLLSSDSDVPEQKTSPSYPPQALFGAVQYVFPDHPGLLDIQTSSAKMLTTTPKVEEVKAVKDDPMTLDVDETVMAVTAVPAVVEPWSDFKTLGGLFFGRVLGAAAGVPGGPDTILGGERTQATTRLNVVFDWEFSSTVDMSVGFTQGSSEGFAQTGDSRISRIALAFRGLGGTNCPVEVDATGQAITTTVVGSMPVGTVLYSHITDADYVPVETAIIEIAASKTPPTNAAGNAAALAAFNTAVDANDADECLYLNPFSNSIPGTALYNAEYANSQELLNWLSEPLATTRETVSSQFDYQVQYEFGDFDGGAGKMVGGIQRRTNSFDLTPNEVSNLELHPCPNPGDMDCVAKTGSFTFLAGSNPLSVEQEVSALFYEVAIPFSDTLELQAAVRYENYGDIDSLDPKVSVRWEFAPGLILRGSTGTTFRGPAPSQSDANSRRTSLALVYQTGAFKAINTLGNPNLSPESAAILNLGFVWQPEAYDLELTADYWSFDFTDPIITESYSQLVAAYDGAYDDKGNPKEGWSAEGAAAVVDQIICSGGNPCAADGSQAKGIERIDVNWVNGPAVQTSGFDLSVRYGMDLGAGELNLGLSRNVVLAYDVDAYIKNGVEVAAAYEALGFLNFGNPSPPLPEVRTRLNASYSMREHTFLLYINIISAYEDQRADSAIDEHQTLDFHYGLDFSGDKGSFTASVLNLTDEAPPSASLDLGYDPYTHNAFGRMIKVGIRYDLF